MEKWAGPHLWNEGGNFLPCSHPRIHLLGKIIGTITVKRATFSTCGLGALERQMVLSVQCINYITTWYMFLQIKCRIGYAFFALIQNKWYFGTKIVVIYCEKKLFYWSRKTFEVRGWRQRICKNFEITRTINSKSGRSEQFLITECFFNLFLEVSQI